MAPMQHVYLAAFVVGTCLFFAPSFIALNRRSMKLNEVCALNLFSLLLLVPWMISDIFLTFTLAAWVWSLCLSIASARKFG
jgi:hypothetical protein